MDSHNTMEVIYNEKKIFISQGKWLYPLFDLEVFLKNNSYQIEKLFLFDKIVGKASALLITRLQFRKVHAGILSLPARMIFEQNHMDYSYDELVEKISCKTETLLQNIDDPKEAYRILKERADR